MATFAGEPELVRGLRLVEADRETDRLGQHRAVRGEFTRLPKAHSVWSALVRQGIVGQAFVILGTILSAVLLNASIPAVVSVGLASAACIAFSLAILPAYERAGSFAPARRLVIALALTSLGIVLFGVDRGLNVHRTCFCRRPICFTLCVCARAPSCLSPSADAAGWPRRLGRKALGSLGTPSRFGSHRSLHVGSRYADGQRNT